MRSTKKTAVTSKDGKTVYAQGRMWDVDDLKAYRAYQHEYAKKYRLFTFRFDQTSSRDLALIKFLEEKESLTGYIRDLVTADMENSRVLADYQRSAEKDLLAMAKSAPKSSKKKDK